MKSFLARNIDNRGRVVRGLVGLALLGAAALVFGQSAWLGGMLAGGGVFGRIFHYRQQRMKEMFGSTANHPAKGVRRQTRPPSSLWLRTG